MATKEEISMTGFAIVAYAGDARDGQSERRQDLGSSQTSQDG